MSEVPVPEVLDLLADDYTRDILVATNRQPMGAKEISEHCSMSRPTVYRRVEKLAELNLVIEQTRVDPESGNHHSVYVANLNDVHLKIADDGFDLTIDHDDDVADRFTRLWQEVRDS